MAQLQRQKIEAKRKTTAGSIYWGRRVSFQSMATKLQKTKKQYKQSFEAPKEWALLITIKDWKSEKTINMVIPIWG